MKNKSKPWWDDVRVGMRQTFVNIGHDKESGYLLAGYSYEYKTVVCMA
jgi:hypothetical protein